MTMRMVGGLLPNTTWNCQCFLLGGISLNPGNWSPSSATKSSTTSALTPLRIENEPPKKMSPPALEIPVLKMLGVCLFSIGETRGLGHLAEASSLCRRASRTCSAWNVPGLFVGEGSHLSGTRAPQEMPGGAS